MPQSRETKTNATKRRNSRTYKSYCFRVRRDSELCRMLTEFDRKGDTSVNLLMTVLLCAHFGCGLPHREYDIYTRIPLVKEGEYEAWLKTQSLP